MAEKHALVIGGGIAGIATALELVNFGIHVDIVEKTDKPGGTAGSFTCKAVDTCVRCGACLVTEKTHQALSEPEISFHTTCSVTRIDKGDRFSVSLSDANGAGNTILTDSVIIATGFKPFDPVEKPYGYGRFSNVITNLDLEKMLRETGNVLRPSDGEPPKKTAYIQCVGSRDESLGHLWCSKVCCGSSLRMAKAVKSRNSDIEQTFFYIDVQTFSKNFQTVFDETGKEIRMIRAIPGDIFNRDGDRLEVSYFDSAQGGPVEELFDMVVLSIGITPGEDICQLSEITGIPSEKTGFAGIGKGGIFYTGSVKGPMSIADVVADAGKTAFDIVGYLNKH